MTKKLQDLVIETLEDHKAKNIHTIDVRDRSSFTDYMIICSGNTKRHVNALAEHVVTDSKKSGHQPLGVEGADVGEWVLVDLGDIIVHIMLPETREFYSLEKIWDRAKEVRESDET